MRDAAWWRHPGAGVVADSAGSMSVYARDPRTSGGSDSAICLELLAGPKGQLRCKPVEHRKDANDWVPLQ